MHTSRHDTYQIKDFIHLFKSDFEKGLKKQLNFRLVCSDYSFAEMHAIIQALNIETINDYCDRVYIYCVKNLDFNKSEKSWLISCVSHTMHRFSKGINNLFTKDKRKSNGKFECFLFSIMLNCNSLNELTRIFENIVIVYKSKTKSKQFQDAYDLLIKLIKNRKLYVEDDSFQNDKYVEKLYIKSQSKLLEA